MGKTVYVRVVLECWSPALRAIFESLREKEFILDTKTRFVLLPERESILIAGMIRSDRITDLLCIPGVWNIVGDYLSLGGFGPYDKEKIS